MITNFLDSVVHLTRGKKDKEANRSCDVGRLAWKPLGRVPMASRSKLDLRTVKAANRYLAHQEIRLFKAREEKKWDVIYTIWTFMLRRSISHQVAMLNKANKGWYLKKNREEAFRWMTSFQKKCIRSDFKIVMKRFYIKKANGKWRPIGSPDSLGKAINVSLTNLTMLMFEENFASYQHGFRIGKSIATAIVDIVKTYKGGDILEFDFKSFFNKIKPKMVRYKLVEKGNKFEHLISTQWTNLVYRVRELKPEMELFMDEGKLTRRGLPQGLPISPVLSTLALETMKPPKGLIMYADDGLILDVNEKETQEWLSRLKTYIGAEIAPEKTMIHKNKVISFLGFTMDFEKNEIMYTREDLKEKPLIWSKTEKISEREETRLIEWILDPSKRESVGGYVKKGKKIWDWTWEPKRDCIAKGYHKLTLNWWERIVVWVYTLWTGTTLWGYRNFWGSGTYDVIGSSTIACQELLMEARKNRPWNLHERRLGVNVNIWKKKVYNTYIEKDMTSLGLIKSQEGLADSTRKVIEQKIRKVALFLFSLNILNRKHDATKNP